MKTIIILILVIVFIGALISLVRIARNKNATTLQLLAMSLDVAYLPSSIVIILWLLGII